MKTIEELKHASLVELAENEKEWKIKTMSEIDNWFKLVIFRQYLDDIPEYLRTCNRFQWMWEKLEGWAKRQKPCKLWAIGSGIVTGISFAAMLIMTIADIHLADQIWAIVILAISAFILTLSTVKLFLLWQRI